jgi:translation elongation factor P/translation initiation factor 5A
MQYTYADGDQYVFMDMETFEETRIEEGDFTKFLKEVGPHRTKYVKALRH